MHKSKHIVIVAGEESGDMHAAVLIKQLKSIYPDLTVSGIGGKHMQEAGADLVYDLARYGVTGVTEVIRYLTLLRAAFTAIKYHLKKYPPDLLILVDYPGFNLRLAAYAKKKLGIKILYYISPQIWAWKAKRIHVIKKYIDKMAVILPFEKALYEKAGIPVSFVGHPLVDKIPNVTDINAQRIDLELPADKTIIALLPGSRLNEIKRHMPILYQTAKLLSKQNLSPGIHFVIPVAEAINLTTVKQFFTAQENVPIAVTFVKNKARLCMAAADFVIVASGTASLECALLTKPMCIIYKSSAITYILAMALIKVKFLGLCNLLVNKMLVPEFLQYDCNAEEIARYVINTHLNNASPIQMSNKLLELKQALSNKKADCSLLDIVLAEMT